VILVVTGFISATSDDVPTTLGRGSSNYSATILSAALDADEVIIWTDVDGVLTADPRLVLRTRTIRETSYQEAAELAFFAAKVLHPKTLRPVMQSGIPVWVRNTVAPSQARTKITVEGSPQRSRSKGSDCDKRRRPDYRQRRKLRMPNILDRLLATTTAARVDVLLISESSSRINSHLAVLPEFADRTVAALRREFAQEQSHKTMERTAINPAVAIVTVVGLDLCGTAGIVEHTFDALDRVHVNIIAIMRGSSGCNFSFVVEQKDLQKALINAHREFQPDVFPLETH